jgi:hypothetical protein
VSPTFTITPSFTVSPTISPTRTPYEPGRLIEIRTVYPNPFSDVGHLYFNLRKPATLTFTVYDVAGEPVLKKDIAAAAGRQALDWKGDNDAGARCASGVYVLRLQAAADDGETDQDWARAAISR